MPWWDDHEMYQNRDNAQIGPEPSTVEVMYGKDMRYANRGRALEELIELAIQQYHAAGIAAMHKVPTAWLPIRNAQGRILGAKVDKKASVDVLGAYRGRAIAFDAKQTKSNRIRWDRVEEHQAEFLDNWEHAGGITFVLVEFGSGDCYVYPWVQWKHGYEKWRRKTGPASFTEERLFACARVPSHGPRRVALDYLAVVDELWGMSEEAV